MTMTVAGFMVSRIRIRGLLILSLFLFFCLEEPRIGWAAYEGLEIRSAGPLTHLSDSSSRCLKACHFMSTFAEEYKWDVDPCKADVSLRLLQ